VLRCVVVVEFAATFQLKRQHPILFDCGPGGRPTGVPFRSQS
jgi:hypothetical protein